MSLMMNELQRAAQRHEPSSGPSWSRVLAVGRFLYKNESLIVDNYYVYSSCYVKDEKTKLTNK